MQYVEDDFRVAVASAVIHVVDDVGLAVDPQAIHIDDDVDMAADTRDFTDEYQMALDAFGFSTTSPLEDLHELWPEVFE